VGTSITDDYLESDEPPKKTYIDIEPSYKEMGKSKRKKFRAKHKDQLKEINNKLKEDWEK